MGERTDQIETDIRHSREDLRSNLQELEHKVKAVTDWKQHFQNHPATMVAAAFGAGALLGTVGRRRPSGSVQNERAATADRPAAYAQKSAASTFGGAGRKHEVMDTLEDVKSALVGVAATQVTGFLGRLVPGFQEHFKKAASARGETGPTDMSH